jgi:hypothetical protein
MDKEHVDRGWFLRWPNGSVYNHATTLDNLTLNQHYRDWRNAEAMAYFVGAIVNSTLLDGVDATFTDDRSLLHVVFRCRLSSLRAMGTFRCGLPSELS